MLQECDLGHRVVVRHRTPLGPTDVLGQLTALDAERLVVRTEGGEEREIRRTDVIAGKPIPDRPPKYSEILAVERIADRAWPAPEVEQLGDWLLRAAEGWTNRANSALPLGDAGLPLDEATQVCRDWYVARGLQPKITVPLPVRRDIARHLEATGWSAQPLVLVQTAAVAAMISDMNPPIELLERPSAQFLDIILARKAALPASADHVLTSVPAVRFAEARSGEGTLLAITRGAVVEDWLHVGLVEVIPEPRARAGSGGVRSAGGVGAGSWCDPRGFTGGRPQRRRGTAVRAPGFSTHTRTSRTTSRANACPRGGRTDGPKISVIMT